MRKDGTVGALAVPLKVLRRDGGEGHGDPDEAVVVDAYPYDVEPRQAALWRPPRAPLAAAALRKPVQWPYPAPHRFHEAKIFLLFVEIGRYVVAHEGEERGDGERLIAVAHHLEIDGMPVIVYL